MFPYDDITFKVIKQRLVMYSNVSASLTVSNSIEMILSGEIDLELNGKIIPLRGPALFWMKAGDRFRFLVKNENARPARHIYCDLTGKESEKIPAFLDEMYPAHTMSPLNVQNFTACFQEMGEYFRLDKEYYKPELYSLLARLVTLIAREKRDEKKSVKSDRYGVVECAREIRKNPFKEYDFHLLSSRHGITYDHFRRCFQKAFQMTPPEYLRKEKLSHAADFLAQTTMRIKEVAFSCNYPSLMEFSRTFKQYYGMSPKDYRSSMGKNSGKEMEEE